MFASIKNAATSPFTKELIKVTIQTTVISAASTVGVMAGMAVVGKSIEVIEDLRDKVTAKKDETPAE